MFRQTILFLAFLVFGFTQANYSGLNKRQCEQVCNSNKPKPYRGLLVASNKTSRLLVFKNQTESTPVFAAFDVKNEIALLWNGTNGHADVYDVKNQKEVLVTPEMTNLTWKLADQDKDALAIFFRNVYSLKVYFDVPNAKLYSFKNIPTVILENAARIAQFMIGHPIPGLDTNRRAGLKYGIKVTQKISRLLNGPLKDFFPPPTGVKIYGTCEDWIATSEVLAEILQGEFLQSKS